MKKILITIIFIISFVFTMPVFAASVPNYNNIGMASAAISTKTGKLIAGKNQNIVLPLASLTKLMTALVLIDLKINLTKKVTITKAEVDYTTPYIAQGDITSKIDLVAGDKVTKDNLWHAMLIASSNEAAAALVDNSGISRKEFVKRMNSKAKALGLTHTKFTEPSGIDPRNISTAKEMAIIARKAFQTLAIRKIGIMPSYSYREINSGRKIYVSNRNPSLLAMNPLGMKVGYLTEAKINCATRLVKNNQDRVVVILHAHSNAARNVEIARVMKK